MATKKLIGRDGKLSTGVKGSIIDGDGETALSDGYYVAKTILESGSGLPAGLTADYPFKADDTIIPETGESVYPITFTDWADVKSTSLEFSKEEIDVTTLTDAVKTYRAGFSDATGNLEGVTTIGATESIIGKFIPSVVQGADLSSINISDIDGSTIFLRIEVNKESTNSEDTAFYIAPVVFTSYSASVAVEGEQTFSAGFRITPDDDIKAAFFQLEQE